MDFTFENSRGDVLQLWNNPLFYLIDQNGQTSANCDVSALTIGDIDGDLITNVRAQPRTIILNLRINPAVDVEEAKRAILKVVKLKQGGTLIWTQNERVLKIDGVVESVEMPRWNNAVSMQISLHCPIPFWTDAEETIQHIDESIPLQYFTAEDDYSSDMLYFPDDGIPFGEYDYTRTRQFYNDGDVDVGMEIEILALDTVTNPIIYDENGNFFGVGYGTKQVTLSAGDVVKISTERGKLSVVKNDSVNLLGFIVPRSTWLQLRTGENTFRINSADESTDNMTFTIIYKQRYI